jgi:hypothetical protein
VGDLFNVSSNDTTPVALSLTPHGWSRQVTPRPGTGPFLSSVFCTAKENCVAVGHVGSELDVHSLAERYLGKRWVARTDLVTDSPSDFDRAVTCAREGSCLAVGARATPLPGAEEIPMAQVLSSSGEWSISSPVPTVSALFKGDSCVASNWCMAAGVQTKDAAREGTRTVAQIVVGGNGWRVLPTPN